ncbi:hypothetical protein [Microbacterium sp.]|uniref:hypothetical protein n=1 Tax=Microbacterium sp. TaxID=51671 RepID=UPI0039E572E6
MRHRNTTQQALDLSTLLPLPRNTGHPDRNERLPLRARFVLWLGGGDVYLRQAIALRRSFPIVAFVGPNGGGKTLCLIVTSQPTRKGVRWHCENPDHQHTKEGVVEGWRRMLSTVPILDGNGNEHPLYDKFDDFEQLVTVEHSDVYMDEVTSVASSRESARMDARVLNKLVQLRKADVMLFWTAPNWARADKVMREVTQAVVECRGYFAAKPATGDGDLHTVWSPRRVFRFRTYDAIEFEEWSAAKRDAVRPLNSHWFKGVGSEAFRAYDTLGAVTMVASITPENTCTVCEGTIVRHRCQCRTAKPRTVAVVQAEAVEPPVLVPTS